MALEDVFKGGNILNGLLIGAGIGLATKVLAPGASTTAGGLLRPVVSAAVAVWDITKQAVATVAETASDIYAEAQHEVAAAKAPQRQPLSDAITDL
jgi:hypothetical protein